MLQPRGHYEQEQWAPSVWSAQQRLWSFYSALVFQLLLFDRNTPLMWLSVRVV